MSEFRSRWPDERLDDLARRINGTPERVIRLEGQVQDLAQDAATAVRAIRDLERHLRQRDEEQRKRDEEQRKERRADRHWLIGTVIAAAALIVAAVGILIGAIT